MSTHNEPTISADRLDALIATYLQAVEAGQVPNRQELLDRHPEFADALRAFFADFDQMDRAAAPLRLAPASGSNGVDGAPTPPTVRYFGDYELLEEIARGGMGVVYKARQASLNRIVALKMVLAGTFASARELQRFRAEAEAAANLDHPGIVPIYEIGEHESQQYFSMRFVEGTSLAKTPRGDARSEVAGLIAVARAVHYAHQRAVLHRDLKPSNVLVDPQGARYVTDFGLAKRLTDTQGSITDTGQLLGTPRYMAPEQAAGRKDLTVAADVYSLGVILYERLTGQTPFSSENVLTLLRQLREAEPPRPSTIHPGLDRDLETVVLKCLDKDPARRYPSAEALADDLARWEGGEPIAARPVGALERAWRWCRRNPIPAALTAAVAVSLVAGTVVSSYFWLQADKRAASERRERQRADALAVEAQLGTIGARIDQALETCERDPSEGLLLLAKTYRQIPTEAQADDFRRFVQSSLAVWGQRMRPLAAPLEDNDQPLLTAALSPDGKLFAGAAPDGTIRVWDPSTGKLRATLNGHAGMVNRLLFSKGGERLISAGGSVSLTEAALENRHWVIQVSHAWVDQGSIFDYAGDKTVRVWNVGTGEQVGPEIEMRNAQVVDMEVVLSPDGRRLACVIGIAPQEGQDSPPSVGFLILETADGRQSPRIACGGEFTMRFSGDGNWLLVNRVRDEMQNDFDGQGRTDVYDCRDARLAYTLPSAISSSTGDGREIATLHVDSVRYWEAATGNPVSTTPLETPLASVYLNPSTIVAAGREYSFRVEDDRIRFRPDDSQFIALLESNRWAACDRRSGRWIAEVKDELVPRYDSTGRIAVSEAGGVWETEMWRRQRPQEGRRFPAAMASAARRGRIVRIGDDLWDTSAERRLGPRGLSSDGKLELAGTADALIVAGSPCWRIMIPDAPLATDPDLVQLWTEVLTRKELLTTGEPAPLSEPEWEARRAKLQADLPTGATPMLVALANDAAHWRRGDASTLDERDPRRRVQACDRLIALEPRWCYHDLRAQAYAQLGEWDLAARDALVAGKGGGEWYWTIPPRWVDYDSYGRLLARDTEKPGPGDSYRLGPEAVDVAGRYLRAMKGDNNSSSHVFTIAAFLARRPRRPADEYMSAERLAAELVKLNSGSANYRSVHGQVLLRLGRFDDAAAQFLQLLEIVKKPGPPGPGSLGVPGAQTEPTPSTEMLEMSPQALAGLALAHYGAGRVDDARRRLDEAREAQRTLARLVTERGDTAPTPHFLVLEAEATIGKQP